MYTSILKVVLLAAVCLVSSTTAVDSAPSTLRYVFAFFRHGIRSPIFYGMRNDPNNNLYAYLSGGYIGGLTEVGKRQMFNIGKSLKARYGQFIGEYREDKVRVSSTGVGRSIMSAVLVMAGMFPPTPRIFRNVLWQPIPVIQNVLDIDMSTMCPKYAELSRKGTDYLNTPDTREKHRRVYELMSEYSQESINSVGHLNTIYDVLDCGTRNGLYIPSWITMPQEEFQNKPLFPDILEPFKKEHFENIMYYQGNEDMIHLHLSQIYNAMDAMFMKVSTNKNSLKRLWFHSTHDTTIYVMLRALGVDSPLAAEPGDGLMFELHTENHITVVKILFYHADSNTYNEVMSPYCLPPCSVQKFVERFKPLSHEQFKEKCGN